MSKVKITEKGKSFLKSVIKNQEIVNLLEDIELSLHRSNLDFRNISLLQNIKKYLHKQLK